MSRQSSRRAKLAPAAAAPVPDSAAASRHSPPAWHALRGPALTAAVVAAWEARDLKALCADGDEPAAAWEVA